MLMRPIRREVIGRFGYFLYDLVAIEAHIY